MTFFSRYKAALALRNHTIPETSRRLEISTAAIYKWKGLPGCPLTATTLMELSKWLNTNPMWLYDGTGLMLNSALTDDAQRLVDVYNYLNEANKARLLERAESLLETEPHGTVANPFPPKNLKEKQ